MLQWFQEPIDRESSVKDAQIEHIIRKYPFNNENAKMAEKVSISKIVFDESETKARVFLSDDKELRNLTRIVVKADASGVNEFEIFGVISPKPS